MKIITFLVMMLCVGVAQAVQVYKCPGKVEGKYTYQERPCPGGKVDEHTLKVMPSDEKKILEAREKLARELEEARKKEAQEKAATTNPPPPPPNPPLSGNPLPQVNPPLDNAKQLVTPFADPIPVPPKGVVNPVPAVPNTATPQNSAQPKSAGI